tara:strand:+ start:715 stop:1281 length:567 start_codon:yes stop_codon:yes gene_type:complete
MKTVLLLFASLLVATNWVLADEEPNFDDSKVLEKILREAVGWKGLEERGPDEQKLSYQVGEQTPYTGWWKMIHDNGQVSTLVYYKDGKREGLCPAWHDNGQKKMESTFKDGKQEGPVTWWRDNGQKEQEATYKDGKPEGLWTMWYDNGQKEQETTYKDGKLEGLATKWNEEGKVVEQTNYKDGVTVKE